MVYSRTRTRMCTIPATESLEQSSLDAEVEDGEEVKSVAGELSQLEWSRAERREENCRGVCEK